MSSSSKPARKPRPPKPPPTYDSEVFNVLAYEYDFSDKAANDVKIKRRLQRKKLGRFDPERIAMLRRLKEEIMAEVKKAEASAYYLGQTKPPYVDIEDFDLRRFSDDLAAKYPQIAADELDGIVGYTVAVNYLL